MIIHVTAEDIAQGVKEDCSKCPVARAILRQTEAVAVDVIPAAGGVRSPIQWIADILPEEGDYIAAHLPGPVVARIEAYDATGVMEPFEFELETEAGTLPYTGGER